MPLAQVQTLLGHALIDTTRGYARSYDGTVAADYTRAMLSVERDLGIDSAREPLSQAQVTALLDSLATLGPLNQQQRDIVARVRAANTNLCQQG
jgi:hypothetical protein